MEIFWYGMMFVLGTIIGSFLNVVIYRLHTGKSLNGRSHCMTCGKTLSWYELFPIVSYLLLKGRCRSCAAYIPSRYLVVELLTGIAYVCTWYFFATNFVLLGIYLLLISVLILIIVYDIRHTIIPDELTAMIGGVAVLLLTYTYITTKDLSYVFESVGAGLGAATFFWGLWYVSKGRWIGLGDAKLALPLGIIVGISGVFSMVVFSFWIGAALSLTLLGIEKLLKRGKTHLSFLGTPLTMKSEVPFAPFLIAAFLLVQLLHADIFTLTYTVLFSG